MNKYIPRFYIFITLIIIIIMVQDKSAPPSPTIRKKVRFSTAAPQVEYADDIDRINWDFIDSLRTTGGVTMPINSPSRPPSPQKSHEKKEWPRSIRSLSDDEKIDISRLKSETPTKTIPETLMRRFKSGYFTINSHITEFIPRSENNTKK
ncbi:hypothetical protein DOLIC_00037 [Dolichomitus sp. PSUC_FEM 10030005]|nr:hypothetical protein [Dolichomitus sp. PSUC_FEM 10030005]